MFVQFTRVFVPTPAARTKQLRLQGCSILGSPAAKYRCHHRSYLRHITSMPCFFQDCFKESYTGSLQARQLEQWDSLLPLLAPSTLPQETKVPEGVMKGSSVYVAVAVLPCVWHGAKVQPWEATPVPANSRQPTLLSFPCATWLTGRLSLLPHRLAGIQEGAFDPAARKNAWWYQLYVCTCNGRLSKVLGTKVLLSFSVTQDLRGKKRDLSWKSGNGYFHLGRLPAAMALGSSQSSQPLWLCGSTTFNASFLFLEMLHYRGFCP